MKVKIYYLRCPKTNNIRYVGRTKNKLNIRLNGHLSKARHSPNKTNYKNNWLKSLIKDNYKPTIELVKIINGWEESYIEEKKIIKKLIDKGVSLVNLDDRGEGGINKIITQKQKNKISKTLREKYRKGLKVSTCVPLYVYDLDGNFIKEFESMTSCAKWLGISDKHIQTSIRRKAKRLHSYQIRKYKKKKINKYKNPRCK